MYKKQFVAESRKRGYAAAAAKSKKMFATTVEIVQLSHSEQSGSSEVDAVVLPVEQKAVAGQRSDTGSDYRHTS